MLVAGCLAVVVFARSAAAQDMLPPTPPPDPTLGAPPPAAMDPAPTAATMSSSDPVTVLPPEHLVVHDQYFEATPAGLRSYLETIKTTNPALYAQLSPDADRLQSRHTTAIALLAGGLGIGVVGLLAGLAMRNDCPLPSVNDPNFAAASSAWDRCNEDNMNMTLMFGVVGFLAATAGIAGAALAWPSRQDLLDVVNKHNRLSPDPLRLQIGYDAGQHVARAGATISF